MSRFVAAGPILSTLHLHIGKRSSRIQIRRLARTLYVFPLLFCVGIGNAQVGQVPGIQMFSTRNFNIDLATSSITTQFPVRSKGGKIPISYSLVGNYQVFALNTTQLTYSTTLEGESTAHTFGYGVGYTATSVLTCVGSNEEVYGGWVVYDNTGASHSLGSFWVDAQGTCFPFPASVAAVDGSGLTVTTTSHSYIGPKNIYDSAGYGDLSSEEAAPTLTDPDGTTITISAINIIDSFGATFLSIPLGNPLNTLTYTDEGNNDQSYKIAYQSFNVKSNFNCSGLGFKYADYSVSATSLPISITDPSGAVTKIGYEATPGYSGYITGRLASITYGSGGSISYAYSQNGDSQGQNGLDCVTFVVPMITVTANDNNGNQNKWIYKNYNRSTALGNFTVTETDPAGNQIAYNFYAEFQTQAAAYQGGCPTSILGCTGGGTLLSTTTTCYSNNFTSCATPKYVILPISQTDIYTSYNGGPSNLVETKLDIGYGNILEVKQYDFGAATPPTGNPLFDTLTYYGQSWNGTSCTAYPSGSYIYNTPCYSYTKSSTGATVAVIV